LLLRKVQEKCLSRTKASGTHKIKMEKQSKRYSKKEASRRLEGTIIKKRKKIRGNYLDGMVLKAVITHRENIYIYTIYIF